MIRFLPIPILLSLLIAPAFLEAEVKRSAKPNGNLMRDAVTHEEISKRQQTAQKKDPIQNLGPPKGETDKDPSKENAPKDLIADSTIVCHGGNLTLLPKRSVLFVPEKLKDRIGARQNIKVKTWDAFYLKNRGWIRTVEVTRDQAVGYKPLNEALLESIQSGSALVVATFKGRPISVLPTKSPEEIPLRSETKPVTYK